MAAAFDPRSVPEALRDARDALAAQAEDAGLNATHVREQALVDGWLVRFAKSRAKRARCVNAIGDGRMPLDERIERAAALLAAAGLPLTFRITPFSQPQGLDAALAERGFVAFEEYRVMHRKLEAGTAPASALPLHEVGPREFAEKAGRLYGDAPERIAVDVERAVSFAGTGIRLLMGERDAPVAAGCVLFDGNMAGLYGVYTQIEMRGRGYAATLIETLLQRAQNAGARHACLQVGAGNAVARALYRRLGFSDCYAYWYRAREIE